MRISSLLVVSAAVLALPVSAAPLEMSTEVMAMTFKAVGPSEISNAPTPTGSDSKKMFKQFARPRPGILNLRRGTSFREADYGVNPNVTFTALTPVEGVEATPTPTASAPAAVISRRSDDAWWEANHLSADDYNENLAEEDPAPPAAATSLPSVPKATDSAQPAADTGSNPHSPITLGRLDDTNTNHAPANPDLSQVSESGADVEHRAGEARYNLSDAVHGGLNHTFQNEQVPTTANIEKTHHDVQKNDRTFTYVIHRRILAPGSLLTRPKPNRMAQAPPGHTFEVNTDALLPEHQDGSPNMSDPKVAAEMQRKKNIGFLNIDSNRESPKKPLPNVDSGKLPLNGTNAEVDSAATNATQAKNTV